MCIIFTWVNALLKGKELNSQTRKSKVLTFQSTVKALKCNHSNESYTEQYFRMVLLFMLYKMVKILESVDKILKCDQTISSNVLLRYLFSCLFLFLLLLFIYLFDDMI